MNLTSWVSSSAAEVLASVLIALAGFIVGTFRRTIVHRFRTRRTRKYWEPLRSRGIAIVLGSYALTSSQSLSSQHRVVDVGPIHEFEPFGVVGFGDVLALMTIQDHLRSLNWHDVAIVHSSNLRSMQERNLVLLGGPDPNAATDLAMEHG